MGWAPGGHGGGKAGKVLPVANCRPIRPPSALAPLLFQPHAYLFSDDSKAAYLALCLVDRKVIPIFFYSGIRRKT